MHPDSRRWSSPRIDLHGHPGCRRTRSTVPMRELAHTRELRVCPSSGRTSTGRPAAGNDRIFRSPDRRFESYRGAIESPSIGRPGSGPSADSGQRLRSCLWSAADARKRMRPHCSRSSSGVSSEQQQWDASRRRSSASSHSGTRPLALSASASVGLISGTSRSPAARLRARSGGTQRGLMGNGVATQRAPGGGADRVGLRLGGAAGRQSGDLNDGTPSVTGAALSQNRPPLGHST
ncbi:hypothetical protein MBT84_27405 [Streptomyces sp. MBT84]|nr:hypothetical protein [Streptomyces sp. MBT84]